MTAGPAQHCTRSEAPVLCIHDDTWFPTCRRPQLRTLALVHQHQPPCEQVSNEGRAAKSRHLQQRYPLFPPGGEENLQKKVNFLPLPDKLLHLCKDVKEDLESHFECLLHVVKATTAPSSHHGNLPNHVFRPLLAPQFVLF